MNYCEEELLPYRLGGLLYTPATSNSILYKLKNNEIKKLTSLVFCLEDAIGDTELSVAEENLKQILETLCTMQNDMTLPLLFIRVRTPEHLRNLSKYLGSTLECLTGFILPKFDMSNLKEYFQVLKEIHATFQYPKYIMPIIESRSIAECSHRAQKLTELKYAMDEMKQWILNIRVGGNDFSNLYGVRRNVYQNIYQIGVVRDILMDILNVFSDDYVVSGPVWEYFDNGTNNLWKDGLKKELELDRLNGFVGKTAIHPSQLPIIYESLQPTRSDFDDAMAILHWNTPNGVSGSVDGSRMNEVKTHGKWAKKTYILGKLYGVRRNCS